MVQSSDFLYSKVSIPIATLSQMCLCRQACFTAGQPASILLSEAIGKWLDSEISVTGTCAGLHSADGIVQGTLANCSAVVQGTISSCSAFTKRLRLQVAHGHGQRD